MIVAWLNERNADVIFRPKSAKTILAIYPDDLGIEKSTEHLLRMYSSQIQIEDRAAEQEKTSLYSRSNI